MNHLGQKTPARPGEDAPAVPALTLTLSREERGPDYFSLSPRERAGVRAPRRQTSAGLSRSLGLAALLALSLAPPALAQRGLKDIPDPDPEIERLSFQMADGFEVNLFAADPILAKPIQMNFDPAGRLWVVSSEVYPQIQPGQTANDKVLVLEDRDGDGRAEKTAVFADGLLIPTGVEPGDGGAYVANSTELLHLRDTDHDGKADARRVVLSGFGTEDTHHILHTFRWGYDGNLYFNQSIYIHSHIETPHGVRRLGGGGIWRFRPDTMELDVFIRGMYNPWGHHFDRWGQSFVTDGAGGQGINYALPGAYFDAAVGAERLLPGLNPGSPKYSGAEVLSGRHLPEDWRGNILTNDFRGNRVCRFVLSEDGAGFSAREMPELIKTRHVAFRPIDVKLGPDGAIYIADWYNPIIQHGEVDFRDPRRDHTRGRIWRVTAKGRPLVERPKLVDAPTDALLDALTAPEDWTRHHARRVLKERGAEAVAPALATRVAQLDPNDADDEHRRLEALWTYETLDVIQPELLARLLEAKDHRVRAAAARVAGAWRARLSDPIGLLAPRVADDHPRVRLEAARSLARIPDLKAAEVAMTALDRPTDRFLDYALWLTARDLAPQWVPAFEAGRFDFGGNLSHLVFALEAANVKGGVRPMVDALREGRIPEADQDRVLAFVAALGEPGDLAPFLDRAIGDGSESPSRRKALLDALLKGTERRKVRPDGDLSRLGPWLDGSDEGLRATAARAAGQWKVESLRPKLVEIAGATDVADPVRREAVSALVQLGGPEGRKAIERLAGPSVPPRARTLAIGALAAIDPDAGAAKAVERLASPVDAADVDDLLSRLLQLKNGPPALAKALAGKTLPSDAAKLAVRAVRGTGRDDARLIDALTKAGGFTASARPATPEEVAALAADASRMGDPARGEAVFRRQEQSCLKCHAIAGAGGQVGPGLESIGASAPADYLVESLLIPGKAIKENYHALVVATADGRVTTGIKVRQDDADLILRDAEDREVAIPLASIDEQKPGGSLMPAGLTDSLTRGELVDLVRFLSELGKIGPYSVSKTRMARRWRVLDASPATYRTLARFGLGAAAGVVPDSPGEAIDLSWLPAYSLVSGDLPLDAPPPIRLGKDVLRHGFVRAELDVSTGGLVKIALADPAGLDLWVDGSKVVAGPEVMLDLKSGIHALTLAVPLDSRTAGLRCTLEDVPGSPARARWVVGK